MTARISEVWAPDENWREKTKADVVTFHSFMNPSEKLMKHLEGQNTFFTSLLDDENVLLQNIKKSFRYEIKRNIESDEVECRVYSPEDLEKEKVVVDDFRSMYTEMYKEKGMDVKLSDLEVYPFIESGALWLTRISKGDETLVYHSYINTGEGIRLLQSCSLFRDKKDEATLIGRSNKRLHYFDMLYFKDKGFSYYDWGGIRSFDEPNGIDKFKLSFSVATPPQRIIYYNGQIGVTLKGKIMLKVYRVFKK